jgi:P-type conjugative transfer protein TrbJ
MKTYLPGLTFAAFALAPAGLAVPLTAANAIPVFDVTNYAQNVLQAARALEQINNQIQSLQNEAAMLRNMERNLQTVDFGELSKVTAALEQIDRLMGEARGIEFKADRLDEQFRSLFPDAGSALATDQRVAGAKARLETALDGFRHNMAIQSQVVANVRDDTELLRELANRSQSAVGSLQAQQATNQLLALSTKQQLQLEELMAAEFRSQSLERARRSQSEAEARAATRRFLGSGKAGSEQR